MRSVVALVAACALLYGCATPWPGGVVAATDPAFAMRQRSIKKVDVLPVDLQLWADSDDRGDPEQLRVTAEGQIVGAVSAALYQRGYLVSGLIDWQGNVPAPDGARAVMPADALVATMDALSTYGSAAARTNGLPVPFLPARLGEVTGADATLYVGGWSFVGDDTSTAETVAKVVLIAVVIVAVVLIVAAAAKGGGHGGGHSGGGGGGGAGNVAAGAGRLLVSAGRVAANTAATAAGAAARVVAQAAPHMIDGLRLLDAFGRVGADTSYEECDQRPDWHAEAPHDGHSATYLEMTLVDNHTGTVLWHARQQFPANASKPDELERVVASLVATLPPAP